MSWCRIRLRSERKMRNRNDSEGDCEVVEELRATYSERKREDEKTGTAEKWMQGTQSGQHQPESIERCDACGIGDDLQLCGKPDSINLGVPGIKLGVANLVTVTGLYILAPMEVLLVVILRVLLVGFMFGNGMSILYSLAGGILSFLVMLLLKRIKGFSMIGISIAGGVSHNIGQIAVAMCVLENTKLIYYLPVLMIAGTVTGILIGVVSRKILPAVSQGAGAERKNK